MKNSAIAKIVNDLEKTNKYVEFKDNGKTYQLFGCDIEKLNEYLNAMYFKGFIMVNNSLKSKDKIQIVEKIIATVSENHKERFYINSKGDLLC